jgi:hypothetical protein
MPWAHCPTITKDRRPFPEKIRPRRSDPAAAKIEPAVYVTVKKIWRMHRPVYPPLFFYRIAEFAE